MRGKLRSRVLAQHGVGVVARTRNGTLVVDPGDFNVARQLLETGEYDWREVSMLARLTNATSRIIFVGAHVGALLIPVVRAAGTPHAMAFEPSPRNLQLLQMNLRLNDLSEVAVENAAVGAAAATVRFTENRINTGNSRVSQDGGEISVAVVTLDSRVPADWDVVDLLVMDVEGFEVNALRGATRTLAMTRYLYIEFAPEQLQEQGSTAEEFIKLVCSQFASAYVMGPTVQFLGSAECAAYMLEFSRQRGRLLNLLFTRDTEKDPSLTPAGQAAPSLTPEST